MLDGVDAVKDKAHLSELGNNFVEGGSLQLWHDPEVRCGWRDGEPHPGRPQIPQSESDDRQPCHDSSTADPATGRSIAPWRHRLSVIDPTATLPSSTPPPTNRISESHHVPSRLLEGC